MMIVKPGIRREERRIGIERRAGGRRRRRRRRRGRSIWGRSGEEMGRKRGTGRERARKLMKWSITMERRTIE